LNQSVRQAIKVIAFRNGDDDVPRDFHLIRWTARKRVF
jgi:hypothetical protein